MHTKKLQDLKWPLSWSTALSFLYLKTTVTHLGIEFLQPELLEKGGGGIQKNESSPLTIP